MRKFVVPFDMDFEDKIIGGKYSLRQAGWLIVPILLGFIFFRSKDVFINEKGQILWISIFFKIIFLIILALLSLILAFYQKNHINFDKYLIKSLKFKLRKKVFKHYE